MQHCCSVMHCVALCCSVMRYVALCYTMLRCVAVWCTVLQTIESTGQCITGCCHLLMCVAVCCCVLPCVVMGFRSGVGTVCCSVLQCVAACYRVLQCVAECVAVCCRVFGWDLNQVKWHNDEWVTNNIIMNESRMTWLTKLCVLMGFWSGAGIEPRSLGTEVD